MESNFFSIVTDLGIKKMVEAIKEKKKVNITSIAVGDGGGESYKPTADMVELKNEIWRGSVNSCKISEDSENVLIIESIIPSDAGGFTIREMGAFDENGEMIMICNTPDTQKVKVSDGVVHELSLSMEVALSNIDSIQLVVDPNVVTASKKDVENLRIEMQKSIGTVGGYSIDVEYKVGDYCIHENKMYKCIEDTTGEWDLECWELTNPIEEIKNLKKSLKFIESMFGTDAEGNMRQLGEAAFAGIAHNFVTGEGEEGEGGENFVAGADIVNILKKQVDEQNSALTGKYAYMLKISAKSFRDASGRTASPATDLISTLETLSSSINNYNSGIISINAGYFVVLYKYDNNAYGGVISTVYLDWHDHEAYGAHLPIFFSYTKNHGKYSLFIPEKIK